MSLGPIFQSIEILSKEKGIDPKIVLDAVKDAMLVAARKHFHTEEELVADLDPSTGGIQIYGVKHVVEEVTDPITQISLADAQALQPDAEIGSEIRTAKPTDVLGRISAQTAKQVILQKVREAERDNVFSEYSGRIGELITCVVKRIEGQDLVADLGKSEARLIKKEQSKLESFSVGDRIRCVIKTVEKAGKNAGVIISRAAPELVMRLFEQEVPEIYDNTVTIKGCAREAGERTKIAVSSRDRDVDGDRRHLHGADPLGRLRQDHLPGRDRHRAAPFGSLPDRHDHLPRLLGRRPRRHPRGGRRSAPRRWSPRGRRPGRRGWRSRERRGCAPCR